MGAVPPKLKPVIANTVSSSGVFARMAWTCSPIFRVYSREAPAGDWMATMPQPWSSSGTKPRGTL